MSDQTGQKNRHGRHARQRIPGALAPAANTTPDAVSLHALLRDYLAGDAKCVAMEVSSTVGAGPVNGVHFDVAVLTTCRATIWITTATWLLTPPQGRLFAWADLKYAVLNMDDPFGVDWLASSVAVACRQWLQPGREV